jgi:hypothetical protein
MRVKIQQVHANIARAKILLEKWKKKKIEIEEKELNLEKKIKTE